MIKKLCLLAIFLSMATLAFAQSQSEQLTITTYYPSPYGVYKNVRLFPVTDCATGTCDAANEGVLCYDDRINLWGLNVCQQTGTSTYSFLKVQTGTKASYTAYCYTPTSWNWYNQGQPQCPSAQTPIGQQGICPSGYVVGRYLGGWGWCSHDQDDMWFRMNGLGRIFHGTHH